MPAQNPQDVLADAGCFACSGASLAELLELGLLDSISQNISVGETFYILTELGDILNAENSDRLVTELA